MGTLDDILIVRAEVRRETIALRAELLALDIGDEGAAERINAESERASKEASEALLRLATDRPVTLADIARASVLDEDRRMRGLEAEPLRAIEKAAGEGR